MKYEIEEMLKSGGGAVVNTSSIFGLNGYPGWSLYTATKHAVTGMTKAAALDYAKKNIRVNAVGPGPVETPLLAKGTGGDPHSYAAFVPMGRIGQPDEIADAVVWLLSDQARFVTGHTLPVDGGVCAQRRAWATLSWQALSLRGKAFYHEAVHPVIAYFWLCRGRDSLSKCARLASNGNH
jgi:NAD(P)-dependent dehydrogenase (short-subunit alcohol dehydrogenase family)